MHVSVCVAISSIYIHVCMIVYLRAIARIYLVNFEIIIVDLSNISVHILCVVWVCLISKGKSEILGHMKFISFYGIAELHIYWFNYVMCVGFCRSVIEN